MVITAATAIMMMIAIMAAIWVRMTRKSGCPVFGLISVKFAHPKFA